MTTTCPIRRIVKRNGALAPYDRERIATAIFKATASTDRPDRALAETMAARVETALAAAYAGDALPSVEDIQDLVESVLADTGRADLARRYAAYRRERAMARAARALQFEVTDNIPYRTIYETLVWNMAHGCDSVDALNAGVRDGRFPALVRDAEARFADDIALAAQVVFARRGALRLVILAGPSSSGKTTTALRLARRLRTEGLALQTINVDHYFFDLVRHPRDEFGDYDYETPQSLDLALLNRHVLALLAGETVKTPRYDFRRGVRTLDADEVRLAPGAVLLLDSLHGLCAEMTRGLPPAAMFRLYVETLDQIRGPDGVFMRWSDHRMLRRMIRDRDHRNSAPVPTIAHWHYVRRSELTHIIPCIASADFILNTALPYELPILRHKLFGYFPEAVARFGEDPKRQDAFVRARRMMRLLEPLTPVPDDALVPGDSVFREFIGGSRLP